ncbi:TetR/AcrR family transcriptional regulator [Chelatococcus reniformis]|uniref:TetR family transcriptional regulator n=1 Tax=Chelatococcus reniformis TaxID=1494448 RepID=A0A916X7E9_9HYPH|nr:TetR family transcriptional regulator [Chelatococcus reniformis]GGC51220.1 TetR family transcriptional regulator [Chelatococcus reniformis]
MRAAPQPRGSRAPRNRLIAIAADHVHRVGAKRVRLVAVAEDAGMTHANVYRYFASKDDLLDAVVGAALSPIEALLADIAGAPDPADDKLERMILALARGYRDVLEREPELFALFAGAVEANRPVARRHLGRARRLFGEVLDDGVATQVFDLEDREAGLSLLIDALHRFTHPMSIRLDADRVRSSLDGRLQATMATVLRALKSRGV